MSDLKKCPFCGANATLEKQHKPDNPPGRQWEYWVECHGPDTDDCQGFNGSEYAYYSEEQCAGHWNTRPTESALLAELKNAEWAGGAYGGECPRCGYDATDGHNTGCTLAAAIQLAGG